MPPDCVIPAASRPIRGIIVAGQQNASDAKIEAAADQAAPPVVIAPLIEIVGLTKRFGSFTAVDDVSFNVAKGEVLGFLGPNGAGKSTTMRMLAGFMTPSSGTARICGHDVREDSLAARREMGFLPEGAPTYPEMTVLGFLRFAARIRGYRGGELADRVDHAIGLTTLAGVRLQPIETLSKGFKRRVGLAQALLHDPRVLILDEPTDGLDPNQKHEVRSLIAHMAPDKAIVISTHILEEVEAVCSRAIIIAGGRVVADATPADLAARDPGRSLDAVFRAITAPASLAKPASPAKAA
jgi:ABC-2 type transport system ATP-binding protein